MTKLTKLARLTIGLLILFFLVLAIYLHSFFPILLGLGLFLILSLIALGLEYLSGED